jgi:hypothetical protein
VCELIANKSLASIVCLFSDNLGLWCTHAYLTMGSDPSRNNTEDPNDNEA